MRPRIIGVGNRADIEKHRARNMHAEIIVRWQRQHAGHLVGRVDDFDFGVVETGGEPIGGDKGSSGGWWHDRNLPAFPCSSLPDLIRQSISFEKTDTRVKPACDHLLTLRILRLAHPHPTPRT